MRRLARLGLGGTVLVLLVAHVGPGPFVAGVGSLDARSLVAVILVTALTTICGAWRWRLVAESLGLRLPLRTAVAASYRAQLLNSTFPGGVVGDVHRGVRHGHDVQQTGRALRAVVWERLWGQAVQVAAVVVALLALPSPWRSAAPRVLVVAAMAVTIACLVVPRALPVVRSDLRAQAGRLSGVVGLSSVVVLGHVAVFLVAARTAGLDVPAARLLPLALLVLVAMAVPANVAGWGPREGVAAWTFGAAGLGASAGVETAVVYGLLVLVASLPGAAVLVVEALARRSVREPEVARA
ncbi:MAG: lysylphosphatidylglycerol synthase domain-containing protein [Nocardioidaceae bacterium]